MNQLDALKARMAQAEREFMQAVADNPLPRTAEEQAYVDLFGDAMRKARYAVLHYGVLDVHA